MPSLPIPAGQPFSLDVTLGCGQVFRWDRGSDGSWTGVVEGRVVRIRQEGHKLIFDGAGRAFIERYFALDVDLPGIIRSFDRDPFIHAAVGACSGLRIIRQPAWECLISYTIATNSNIPTIRRRIAALAERFGKPVAFGGETYYAFPEPGDIACEDEGELACCRLGYRQPFVFRNACDIPDRDAWEATLRALPYEGAREELMQRMGIGPKAADCIALFALEKYDAFPVDVWIRRIMQEHYPVPAASGRSLSRREYDAIRAFGREHFGEFCGYAQEYLFGARLEK